MPELPEGFRRSSVEGYWLERDLPDGRLAAVGPQLNGAAQIVAGKKDGWQDGHEEQWMYPTVPEALGAFAEWDGKGEPEHWIRHVPSGRRRQDGDASKETVRP